MHKEKMRRRIPLPASAFSPEQSSFPLSVAVIVLLILFTPAESSSGLRPSPATTTTRRLDHNDNFLTGEASMLCPVGCSKETTTRPPYSINPSGKLFTEVSYMAISQQKSLDGNAVAWVGSDGKQTSISAVDLVTGDVVRTVELDVERKGDWEAMSLGPCTSLPDSNMCMFLGNVGNNGAHNCRGRGCTKGREEVHVYKFEESDLTQPAPEGKVEVSTLILDYNHADLEVDRADCEAMFADFTGDNTEDGSRGDLYLMTKFPSSKHLSRLTKVPASVHENLKPSESVEFSVLPVGKPIRERTWTGADMSLDGTLVAIRDYSYVYFFPRLPWTSVGDALTGEPCRFQSRTKIGGNARQFEAVAIMGGWDGVGGGGRTSMAEASECLGKEQCEVGVNVCELDFDDGASDFRARIFQTTAEIADDSLSLSSDSSSSPSSSPSSEPTTSAAPSGVPSVAPSMDPSSVPTTAPSDTPSGSPSAVPSPGPSVVPSDAPSLAPTSSPSGRPSSSPSVSPEPTSPPMSMGRSFANGNAFAELNVDRSDAYGRLKVGGRSLVNTVLVASCLSALAMALW